MVVSIFVIRAALSVLALIAEQKDADSNADTDFDFDAQSRIPQQGLPTDDMDAALALESIALLVALDLSLLLIKAHAS